MSPRIDKTRRTRQKICSQQLVFVPYWQEFILLIVPYEYCSGVSRHNYAGNLAVTIPTQVCGFVVGLCLLQQYLYTSYDTTWSVNINMLVYVLSYIAVTGSKSSCEIDRLSG